MLKFRLLAITIALLMMIPVSNAFGGSACKKDHKAAKAECKKMEDSAERKKCKKTARKKYKKCKRGASSGGYGGGY